MLQANKPVALMRPTDVLEALPFVPLYEGVLYHFNELSTSASAQGLAYEAENIIESIDSDSADLYFPDNFSPVPIL